jgi:SPP1 family phage portal protein
MANLTKQSGLTGEQIVLAEREIPRNFYKQNDDYYVGENTAILTSKAKKKPDNKFPIAFVNRITKNLMGYAARPGDITTLINSDDTDNVNDKFAQVHKRTESKNKTDLLNTKLYKSALKHGIGYELVWTEENTTSGHFEIKDADIPVNEGYPIWDAELSTVPKLSMFIRYYERTETQTITITIDDIEKVITLESGDYANVYIKGGYEIWKFKDDEKNSSGTITHEVTDSDKAVFKIFIDQPFKDLQVIPYQANDEVIPYWMPVKRIIDQYDKIMSGNMNEADRFNDTWLMFMQNVDPETMKTIDEMGVVQNLKSALQEGITDVWPRFLERDIPVEHSKLMMDTLEQLIYTIIGVPSFLSETFNDASGVALLFRLIGLEYAAVEIDMYFDLGLSQRLELYKQATSEGLDFYGVGIISADDVENITGTINHRRNLPLDLTTILQQSMQLKALGLSDKVVLSLLPKQVIPNIEDELKAIEQKKLDRQLGINSIIEDDGDTDINTTSADKLEQEAQAKLRGSVGGVKGILDIQTSVSEGKTQYASAIEILMSIYGFTIEESQKILGQPIDKTITTKKVTQ